MPSYTFPAHYPNLGARGTILHNIWLDPAVLHEWKSSKTVQPKFKGFTTPQDLLPLSQWYQWILIWKHYRPDSSLNITVNPDLIPLAQTLLHWKTSQWRELADLAHWNARSIQDHQAAVRHFLEDASPTFSMFYNWSSVIRNALRYRFLTSETLPMSPDSHPLTITQVPHVATHSAPVPPMFYAQDSIIEALPSPSHNTPLPVPHSKWEALQAAAQLQSRDSLTHYLTVIAPYAHDITPDWLDAWQWPPQVKERLKNLLTLTGADTIQPSHQTLH